MTTSDLIKANRLVPVFNHSDLKVALRVINACYQAGITVFEWTNRGEEAMKVFSEVMSEVAKNLPGMTMGAGTVFNGMMAGQYIDLGASFIVSPVLEPEVRDVCHKRNIPWIPGAGTLTEIHQAQKWGAEIVKIFPGDAVGGPAFVKAIRGPMPWAQIMPTGGVSPVGENLQAWFDAGVCCVGMGSQLFTKELILNEDATPLTLRLQEILSWIRK